MMMNKNYKEKGFTLLEMIISMAIIGVLSIGVITTVNLFLRSLQFSNEQAAIINGLERIFTTLEANIHQIRETNSNQLVIKEDEFGFPNALFSVQSNGSHLQLLFNGSPLSDLLFSNLHFRYYFYIPNTTQEIVQNGGNPAPGIPIALRVVELEGEIFIPRTSKSIPFTKPFFVEYHRR